MTANLDMLEMRKLFPGVPDWMLRKWCPIFTMGSAKAFSVVCDDMMKRQWLRMSEGFSGVVCPDCEPEEENLA